MYELSIKAIYEEYEERSEAVERKQKKMRQLDQLHDDAAEQYEKARSLIVAQVDQLHEELIELKDAMEVLGESG